MKIEDLLARPEGKTLEFKRDLSSPGTARVPRANPWTKQEPNSCLRNDAGETPAVPGRADPESNPEAVDFRVGSGLLTGGLMINKECQA